MGISYKAPGACDPDVVQSQEPPNYSSEPAMSEVRDTLCDAPEESDLLKKEQTPNFIAELDAEEAKIREAQGLNWLEQPKDGFSTGREWAVAEQQKLRPRVDKASRRADRLEAFTIEAFQLLTDADMVGRILHGRPKGTVQTMLGDCHKHADSAKDLVSKARMMNGVIDPLWSGHSQAIGDVYAHLGEADQQLIWGENLLDSAMGTAVSRAQSVKTGLEVTSYVGKMAGAVGTGGLGSVALAAGGEAAKQAGQLLVDDDITEQDIHRAVAHTGIATVFGLFGSALPEGAKGIPGKIAEGALTSTAMGLTENAGHNALDGKNLMDGAGMNAAESGPGGVLGKFADALKPR